MQRFALRCDEKQNKTGERLWCAEEAGNTLLKLTEAEDWLKAKTS